VLQPELLEAALQQPARTVVVTRNQHTAEIRRFLDAAGVPDTLAIRRCMPHETKAAVITAQLAAWAADAPEVEGIDSGQVGETRAMFIDDDISELTAFSPKQALGVIRVHFAEGVPKW
jgi:hypothetical protein